MTSLKRTLLAACIATASSLAAHAADLSFWSWRVEDKAFYDEIARQYKAATGDTIKFTAYKNTEYPAVLSAALAAGSGPDIIHTRAYGGISTLSDAGYLVPLSKDNVPNLAAFGEGVMGGAMGRKPPHNKNAYGVPFATQSLGIFYNKTVLAKAGIAALPATWGEFKQQCAAIKAKGIACLANGSKESPILEQLFGVVGPNVYGGTEFFKAVMNGSKKLTDPAYVKAIDEVVALKEFFPPNEKGIGENESRALFAADQAAYYMTGTWNIDTIRDLNPKADFGFMPAPPLAAGGPTYVSTWVDGTYAVNAKSPNQAAALKFVNFLAGRDYGNKFTAELKQPSAVPGVSTTDPILKTVLEQTAKHGTPFIMLVGFRYDNPNGSVLLRDGIQKIMQGQGTSAALANEVQTGVSTWFKP